MRDFDALKGRVVDAEKRLQEAASVRDREYDALMETWEQVRERVDRQQREIVRYQALVAELERRNDDLAGMIDSLLGLIEGDVASGDGGAAQRVRDLAEGILRDGPSAAARAGGPDLTTEVSAETFQQAVDDGAVPADAVREDSILDDPGFDDPGLDDPGFDDPGLDDPGLDDAGLDDAGLDDVVLEDDFPGDAGHDDGPIEPIDVAGPVPFEDDIDDDMVVEFDTDSDVPGDDIFASAGAVEPLPAAPGASASEGIRALMARLRGASAAASGAAPAALEPEMDAAPDNEESGDIDGDIARELEEIESLRSELNVLRKKITAEGGGS